MSDADIPIGTNATGRRTESDSTGSIEVPAEHYWGAQTERSLDRRPHAHSGLPRLRLRQEGRRTGQPARGPARRRPRRGQACLNTADVTVVLVALCRTRASIPDMAAIARAAR